MEVAKGDKATPSPLWEAMIWEPRHLSYETAIPEHALQKVRELLGSGYNPNEEWDYWSWYRAKVPGGCVVPTLHPAEDEYCSSPLFSAILDDNTDMGTLLIEHGADMEQRTRQGMTALHLAVRLMKIDFVKLLVSHGADLEAITVDSEPMSTIAGCFAVHHAVLSAQLETLQDLLELGANVQATAMAGWSILDIAILYQRVNIIEYLVLKHPSLLTACSQHSEPPLVDLDVAQLSKRRQIASHLVNKGAQGTDEQHRRLFLSCMREVWSHVDLKVCSTIDIGEFILEEAETTLIGMAGLSDQPFWAPKFCEKCSEFMTQETRLLSEPFEHSPETSSLTQSALTGCPLCQILSKTLNRDSQNSNRHIDRSLTSESGVRLKVVFPKEYTGWFCGDDLGALVVQCNGATSRIDLGLVDEQTRLAVFKTGPSDLNGSGSVRSLAVAKAWLDYCETYHNKCHIDGVPELPARVIAIGDNTREPFLLCSTGTRARYAALSYCWGGTANLRTIAANLRRHSQAIPFQEMPKTIQDAVTITRGLGIQYLWVDSLCIVQDSVEDFMQQAALMGDIYANATLTIAAKDASDSKIGCLSDRMRESTAILPLKFIFPQGPGNKPHRSPRINKALLIPKLDAAAEKGRKGAIDLRGWTLQEQLLSRRILNCWSHELSWSCLERDCSEFSPRTPTVFGSVREDGAYSARLAIARKSRYNMKPLEGDELFREWLGVVEEYSKRQLSDQRDRIIALAGLQSRFATILHDTPLLGGWRDRYLWPSLLWYCPSTDPMTVIEDSPYPSWAWPSGTGLVKFMTCGLGQESSFDPVITAWNLDVVEQDVRVKGSITVRCRLLPWSALQIDEADLNERNDFTIGPLLALQTRLFAKLRQNQAAKKTATAAAAAAAAAEVKPQNDQPANQTNTTPASSSHSVEIEHKPDTSSYYLMLLADIPHRPPPRYGYPASPNGIPASALFMVLHKFASSSDDRPHFRKTALYQEYEHESWRRQLQEVTIELF